MKRKPHNVPAFTKGLHFKAHGFPWVILENQPERIILDGGKWVTHKELTKAFESGKAKEY